MRGLLYITYSWQLLPYSNLVVSGHCFYGCFMYFCDKGTVTVAFVGCDIALSIRLTQIAVTMGPYIMGCKRYQVPLTGIPTHTHPYMVQAGENIDTLSPMPSSSLRHCRSSLNLRASPVRPGLALAPRPA